MAYKGWISIEDVGDQDDNAPYTDEGLPDSLGYYEQLSDAQELVRVLLRVFNPAHLETSDHREPR